jgi:hypothetical protein
MYLSPPGAPLTHIVFSLLTKTVIMDILGVILAVTISRTILDGPFGAFLIAKLSAGA